MAGVVKITHQRKRQLMHIRQPFDYMRGLYSQRSFKVGVIFSVGFVVNIPRKEAGCIINPRLTLKARARCRDQPRAKGGRP